MHNNAKAWQDRPFPSIHLALRLGLATARRCGRPSGLVVAQTFIGLPVAYITRLPL